MRMRNFLTYITLTIAVLFGGSAAFAGCEDFYGVGFEGDALRILDVNGDITNDAALPANVHCAAVAADAAMGVDITSNTGDISDNAGDISDNTDAIAGLGTSVTALGAAVDANHAAAMDRANEVAAMADSRANQAIAMSVASTHAVTGLTAEGAANLGFGVGYAEGEFGVAFGTSWEIRGATVTTSIATNSEFDNYAVGFGFQMEF